MPIELSLDQATIELLTRPETSKEMKFVNFVNEKKRPLSLTLECEAVGELLVGDFGHSVLCTIISEDQKDIIMDLEDEISKNCPESFQARQFMRDERFFLKLPTKDGEYKATTVPRQDPANTDKSSFAAGVHVTIECKPGAYFNFKEEAAGLFLTAKKITIGKPKNRKR